MLEGFRLDFAFIYCKLARSCYVIYLEPLFEVFWANYDNKLYFFN